MSKTPIALAVLLGASVLVMIPAELAAQSSLGIGNDEPMITNTGLFSGLLAWINARQQEFYRALTGALKAMRNGEGGLWILIGLSFTYGIFHAAGPGHGKAIISSYMLANEVALRRGVLLSFVSAMLQAVTALVLMGAVFLLLRGTSVSMTDASRFLEIASYLLIMMFGAWLLWRKVPVLALAGGRTAPSDHHDHHHHHDHAHHHHGPGEVCETCGHAHAPDPSQLAGKNLDWRTAWSAVAAVGLRPCSGALIVLTFAFLNGLWLGGVLSVFAMAIGTAITVSALATLAVTAKNWAMLLSGQGRFGNIVHAGIEIGGALLVFLIGLALFSAAVWS